MEREMQPLRRRKPAASEQEKRRAIEALQALSTFFVDDAPAAPGFNYAPVALRCLSRFLDRDPQQLRADLVKLAEHGLCELTLWEARLTPGRWARNPSRWAAYLAYYVSQAPAELRGPDALVPVSPERCLNPQPKAAEGKSVTITGPFTGVFSSVQHRAIFEAPSDLGPFELATPWHSSADPALTLSLNLNFLRTPSNVTFRAFLSAAYLQTVTVTTANGPVGQTLAEHVDTRPCALLAPADDLGLDFTSLGAAASPFDFVAPLLAVYCFADPESYPIELQAISGAAIKLRSNGVATLGTANTPYLFQLLGGTARGSYLVALTAPLPAGVSADRPGTVPLPFGGAPC
jgi:hypothetical protein